MSIYDKSHLVSTSFAGYRWAVYRLIRGRGFGFALENDVTALEDMKSRVHKWAEKLDLLLFAASTSQGFGPGGQKQQSQSSWCLD